MTFNIGSFSLGIIFTCVVCAVLFAAMYFADRRNPAQPEEVEDLVTMPRADFHDKLGEAFFRGVMLRRPTKRTEPERHLYAVDEHTAKLYDIELSKPITQNDPAA